MKLLLVDQSHERGVRRAWLSRWIQGLSRQLAKHGYRGVARKELVVVFVTRQEIRRLNRLYRDVDRSTDVLSFAPAETTSLGELVLCRQYINRQSRLTGLSATGELGYMIVHGVLHLLGLDHKKPRDRERMFALQETIYSDLARTVGFR